MNLMPDGWHYKGNLAIFVDLGKVTKYLCRTFSGSLMGFELTSSPPVAWDESATWNSLQYASVRRFSVKEISQAIMSMPNKCKSRILHGN